MTNRKPHHGLRTPAIVFIICMTIALQPSCKKDKDETPPVTSSDYAGYWIGTYTLNNTYGLHILFRANGTAKMFDMGSKTDTADDAVDKFEMDYVISGNSISLSDNNQSFTGSLNSARNKIEGNFKAGSSNGSFTVAKQQ